MKPVEHTDCCRAERRAAAPPLPISFNQRHLCGGPLPAALYKTVSLHPGAWRRSCGGFSIGAEHMEPLGTSGLGLCWRTCTNLITEWAERPSALQVNTGWGTGAVCPPRQTICPLWCQGAGRAHRSSTSTAPHPTVGCGVRMENESVGGRALVSGR